MCLSKCITSGVCRRNLSSYVFKITATGRKLTFWMDGKAKSSAYLGDAHWEFVNTTDDDWASSDLILVEHHGIEKAILQLACKADTVRMSAMASYVRKELVNNVICSSVINGRMHSMVREGLLTNISNTFLKITSKGRRQMAAWEAHNVTLKLAA